ncbi:hypothetical protein [Rhizobium sp. LjRoot254]|uniref:hypothetical protein n=1 Tax=Rhizobium sp. LjRoot254 TaxID=3342297 RepID=UPI003ECE0937
MFAGRYLWWNMFAAMAYVFFAIYFFYVSWLAIRVSGCASLAGSCGGLEAKLNAVVRPYGMVACGIIVLACGIMRIRFLKMSPLWGLAFFVWFGTSAEFFFTFGNLWFAHVDMGAILAGMPIETLFLAALVIFLCFPVELYRKSPEGGLRVMYFVAGFTASYSFSFTVANSPQVLNYVRLISGNDTLVASIAEIQARMRHFLSLGHEGLLPMVVVLAIFIGALSYLLWIRKQPGGAPAAVAA